MRIPPSGQLHHQRRKLVSCHRSINRNRHCNRNLNLTNPLASFTPHSISRVCDSIHWKQQRRRRFATKNIAQATVTSTFASTALRAADITMPKAKSNGAKLKSNGTADADDLSTLLQDTLRVSEDVKISKDLRKVADWISGSSKKKPKVLVLTGAGVSVAAGIPDFRTPGTGLYDNLQSYNLPYPEAVFDVRFYRSNPQPFCALAKEIWPGLTHSPTLTHSFLALLSQKGYLLRNYSQNIDGLEFLAGIPDDELVECHGHFRTASCIDCGASMDGSLVKDSIVDDSAAPQCSRCGGYVKPDIVFFGESLPNRFHQLLKGDVGAADILLVMGTSLQVAPVSLIPSMVNCKRALFNRDLVMRLNGKEDAFVEGDCDSNVRALCKALGWEDELLELNAKTRLRPKQKDENGKKKSKSGGNGGGTTQRRGKRDKAT